MTTKSPPITGAQARVFLRRWQRELKLRDWSVKIRIEALPDDIFGDCSTCPDNRSATIRIAADCPPARLEETVVHELLHLFGPYVMGEGQDFQRLCYEQLLNTVDALLAKWRPDPKPPKKRKAYCPPSQ